MHGGHLLNSLKMYFMKIYGSLPVMTSQRSSANPSITTRITQRFALPGSCCIFFIYFPDLERSAHEKGIRPFLLSRGATRWIFKNWMRKNDFKKKRVIEELIWMEYLQRAKWLSFLAFILGYFLILNATWPGHVLQTSFNKVKMFQSDHADEFLWIQCTFDASKWFIKSENKISCD